MCINTVKKEQLKKFKYFSWGVRDSTERPKIRRLPCKDFAVSFTREMPNIGMFGGVTHPP